MIHFWMGFVIGSLFGVFSLVAFATIWVRTRGPFTVEAPTKEPNRKDDE